MIEIITLLGFIATIITIIGFFTGKPTIFHFLQYPVRRISDYFKPLFTYSKVVIEKSNLILKTQKGIDILLLKNIGSTKYKILISPDKKRYLLLFNSMNRDNSNYESVVVINNDGSYNKLHEYVQDSMRQFLPETFQELYRQEIDPTYFILMDANWFDDNTYIVNLKYGLKPFCFHTPNLESICKREGDYYYIPEGYYLVKVNFYNDIISIEKFNTYISHQKLFS